MLSVGPGCLVPRPDTETLVEAVVEAVDEMRHSSHGMHADPVKPSMLCLELGTGTGAIPLAVCSERERLVWVACEISKSALLHAQTNLAAHAQLLSPRHNAIHLVRASGLGAISPMAKPHLIVSNPPYISRDILPTLEPEVSRAEPAEALDGGLDGLGFHRELVSYAAEALIPGGRLLLEIGSDQGSALRELLTGQGSLELREIRKDLAGHDRVVHALKS